MATNCEQHDKIDIRDLKDVKDINDIDLDKLELLRGETPVDIQERCLSLCQQYLGSNWEQQTVDTIKVVRVSGGMTNQLYYCGIEKPSSDPKGVPQEVAIRLYGSKYFNKSDCEGNERLTDVVTTLLVSKNKLGPKIYGIFDDGQIQAYYKHRAFQVEEQKDWKLVTELFQKLARVHAMDVPIKKTFWSLKEVDMFYEKYQKKTDLFELISKNELFAKNDLKAEIEWMKSLVERTDSPMVFTHNDFRSSNIMVLEDNNNNINETDGRLVLCDFEYSSYGYRGHDFGIIMGEWGRTMNDNFKKLQTFPDDETLKPIFDIYIKESERVLGKELAAKRRFTMDVILREAKVFTLFMQLFLVVFIAGNDSPQDIPMDNNFMMQFADMRFRNYLHLKEQFKQQKVFD